MSSAFTALIGDPTGRSKTRPLLTMEEIAQNSETYKTQIFVILDPAKTVTRFSSEWLEPPGSVGWIKLEIQRRADARAARVQAALRAASRSRSTSFCIRWRRYDSVVLNADVELGGTDQLFNLNVGRDLMPAFDLEPQIVMTTPLLEGLDGVEKMSKSLGNYVGVTEPASEMFGKADVDLDDLMERITHA